MSPAPNPSMNLFMQGMRRSGTTIIFDALCQDAAFTAWYEPLAAAKRAAIGGGSEMRDVDYFENVRAARVAYATAASLGDPDVLNYGAPRAAELEFEPDLPGVVLDYLRHLVDRSDAALIKFTRMYDKVPVLGRLDPGACFVHLVRDPRAVVASYLFGKGRRNEARFTPEGVFFGRRTDYTAWSSHRFSELIRRRPGYEQPDDIEDFARILLIWKYTTSETRRGARDAFGERCLTLRHEDFQRDPRAELERVYARLGRPAPLAVLEWASANVRAVRTPYAARDPRWSDAFERLGMTDDVAALGYA